MSEQTLLKIAGLLIEPERLKSGSGFVSFLRQIERIFMGFTVLVTIVVLGGGMYFLLLLGYYGIVPMLWAVRSKILVTAGLLAIFWTVGRVREYVVRNKSEEKPS